MTEDQAKTKRCCGPDGCGFVGNDGLRYCCASECMAWRWQWVRHDDPPMGVNAHECDSDGNWFGYCGLAGKC